MSCAPRWRGCAGCSPRRPPRRTAETCRFRPAPRLDSAHMTAVDAIIARLLSLHPKRIDLSLDRIARLLERLDHPERRLPPVVHVTGTNGKGSTIAFMRAILEATDRS